MSKPMVKVLDIQRLSTEDGPGLRTTVFLKGCPLRCAWGHNPESIQRKEQFIWLENHCIGCRLCVDVCPNHAITLNEYGQSRNLDICSGCQKCADILTKNLPKERDNKSWREDNKLLFKH